MNKMMSKNIKHICLVMALLMMFAMSACGGNSQSQQTTPAETAAATTAATTTATTTEATSTAATTTTEAATTEATTTTTTTAAPTTEATTTEAATETTTEENTTEQTSEAETTAAAVTAGPGGLPGELYSFQAELNGVVYQLPMLYEVLEADGWIGRGDFTDTLNPNTLTNVSLEKDGIRMSAGLVNLDVNVLEFNECYIFRFSTDQVDAQKGLSLILPGGITIGSTLEDVVGAYGDPTRTNESTDSVTYNYEQKSYASAQIRFETENNTVTSIRIENAHPTGPVVSKAPQGAGEIPDAVMNYKAPTELGDDYSAFIVRFMGDLYKIPAPVSAFVENGWSIVDTDVSIPARSYQVGYTISRNNQNFRTNLRNYSDTIQPSEYTFVTKIKSSEFGPDVPIELPGGITRDSTADDLIAAYGEPDDVSDSADFDYFTYGSYGAKIDFSIRKETGKIVTIEFDYDPKTLD